ncbi:hypothetical protein ABRC46_001960 [Salmonella enterica]|nr:hypothetical protein [Salmonella enterica]EGP6830220.1 hypothetical protein [Salmonella enterica]EGS4698232.1 hypothetical protein [Salmonella enterica]EIJ8349264.1 hypothetical protein [Salmonella enterica]EIX3948890.1 hypothetical protein [Salmonella enterica]
MTIKQKYTNRAKVIAWNKDMRIEFSGPLPSSAVGLFTFINTIEGKERALALMQQHLDAFRQETPDADV